MINFSFEDEAPVNMDGVEAYIAADGALVLIDKAGIENARYTTAGNIQIINDDVVLSELQSAQRVFRAGDEVAIEWPAES